LAGHQDFLSEIGKFRSFLPKYFIFYPFLVEKLKNKLFLLEG